MIYNSEKPKIPLTWCITFHVIVSKINVYQ